jgi:hypothetical protein
MVWRNNPSSRIAEKQARNDGFPANCGDFGLKGAAP